MEKFEYKTIILQTLKKKTSERLLSFERDARRIPGRIEFVRSAGLGTYGNCSNGYGIWGNSSNDCNI